MNHDLDSVPVGTILGVFTVLVIIRPFAKQLFCPLE
jgi:flagellar motor component MotA